MFVFTLILVFLHLKGFFDKAHQLLTTFLNEFSVASVVDERVVVIMLFPKYLQIITLQ